MVKLGTYKLRLREYKRGTKKVKEERCNRFVAKVTNENQYSIAYKIAEKFKIHVVLTTLRKNNTNTPTNIETMTHLLQELVPIDAVDGVETDSQTKLRNAQRKIGGVNLERPFDPTELIRSL